MSADIRSTPLGNALDWHAFQADEVARIPMEVNGRKLPRSHTQLLIRALQGFLSESAVPTCSIFCEERLPGRSVLSAPTQEC
ncbi:hypothetical protein GX50_08129 [[Emmonsia] crescens]|uniref:Uncharacterized protein n=1 Tax=[Emmonsia] crescens TaxID=73230 RepID=A0A2B7YYF1_9EURO|nr:hypothetical protein GX50_08129 [Emmonsia crescens]